MTDHVTDKKKKKVCYGNNRRDQDVLIKKTNSPKNYCIKEKSFLLVLFSYTDLFLHELADAVQRYIFRFFTSDFNFSTRVFNSTEFCVDLYPAELCFIAGDIT